MRYLSVCSGIEAATVAWHPFGWRPFAFSEIETFPSRVLAHHYSQTPNLGDMTRFQEWPDAAIDLLVGGTPCQSFSVAGLRKGLDDPRGNLMLVYGAIAGRYRPRWLVWENVPGVLSSNGGRDFGTFLGMLAELGYGFAYRILDAQYVRVDGFDRAVPQRRGRVFVVGYLGDWRRAAAVLFECESLSRHPAPRREAREGIAPTISARTRGGGGLGTDFDCDGGLIPQVPMCLNAGGMGRQDSESETLIAHSLRADGFDASEDGTGRGTPIVPVVHVVNGNSAPETMADCAFPLRANDGSGNRQALAFDCKASGRNGFGVGEISPTLHSMGHTTSHANGGSHAAVAVALRGRDGLATAELGGEAANALRASQGGGDKPHVLTDMAVRRLTPVECERLQGFPSVTQKVIIEVCIDRQLNIANVALSCLKWLDNVLLVDESELTPSAQTAAALSNTRQVGQEPLVAVHVRMRYGAKLLAVRNHGKSILCANGAEPSGKYLHHPQTGDTVPALAQVALELANLIRSGKAVSLQSTSLSLPVSAGSKLVPQSGGEIAGNAADVETVQNEGKFTTSDLGLLTPISATPIAICCCSAMAAISGFIQSETLPENFSLELIVESDYTDIRPRGKPTPDGPRYKALGNSMAVNCMRWIGQRIAAVEAIQLQRRVA